MGSDPRTFRPRSDLSDADTAIRGDDSGIAWLRGDEDAACDLLADLAGTGRTLEFGIGDGRIALPLAERGIEVAGVDLYAGPIDRLRTLPGGTELDVALGDMTSVRLAGTYSLVYLVFKHDLQPADAGRPGALLRERRPAPHRGRRVRRRDRRPEHLDRRARVRPPPLDRP